MAGRPKSRGRWVVQLIDGRLQITARNGSELTEDDRKTLILVLTEHFRVEGIQNDPRVMRRPEAGEDMTTKTGMPHVMDSIVTFFTAYRVKRKIPLVTVARRLGHAKGSRLGSFEAGRTRPYMDILREWGYALNFNIMPVPVSMAARIQREVNEHIEREYENDIQRWSEDGEPSTQVREVKSANISAGSEFLRDSFDTGSAEVGQAEGGMLPATGNAGGHLYHASVGESPSD